MSQTANLATDQTTLGQPNSERQQPEPQRPVKLLNWNFVLLWQGQVVSGLGAQFYAIAMVLWIKQATSSASLLGLINTLTGFTAVLLGVFAGTLADRYARRKIIIVSDLVRGILMLVLSGLFFMMPQSTSVIVLWMMVTAVSMSAASSFFRPAIAAAMPELVPEDQLTRANSLTSSSSQITRFLGQALGGLLFRLLGAPLITLVNGVTYIFSAISEMFIKIPQNIPEKSGDWRKELDVFKQDLLEGFHYTQ
ncbi:MFS transporter [Chloroflexi bacterium TSY]|nr:MFS transporter [Chloroflexi bacterium TSY]